MNEKTLKFFVIILSVMLLIIFTLAVAGFTDPINFWIAAILIAVFAFIALPKLNKQTNKQLGKN